ncbi:MAG TPA: ABC transporter permease [Nocardioides sp.]|uniref:sugar ABC transporter permease n=1 Tax=Nocardioides sp. TaxID=35761 RepID=UPI002BB32BB1|nr:ABC transporter permease [Nocardioides sp.]HQR28657.1 ABC transporter permease [Nocardioides sp.]
MSRATANPDLEDARTDTAGPDTLSGLTRDYIARVRGGDVGSLPAILGLLVLVLVFSALKPDTFTNSFNFANLINQSAGVMVIAMGLVFVLLLGEIDLSAGYTAGTAAAMTGIVMTRHEMGWFPSILTGIATGAVIGLFIGLVVARLGVPSFVVTLAMFLGLQGVMLLAIGEGGTIPYRNETVLALMNKNLPLWLGWTLCLVGVLAYALTTFLRARNRRAAGLHGDPMVLWAIKSGVLAAALIAATAYLSVERSRNPVAVSLKGVPVVVVVLAVLLILLTFLLSRTAWGRHVYAVGGNAEAARRAGINVARIKISCFMLCSALAGIAGLLIASRDNSVSPATGGSSTLLYAVGAAVIGGTSLFGGKGRPLDAVIGGLVVAVINNGMLLLNQPAGRVYIVTGLVLLLAASVDAISRRRAVASGRA